MPTTLTVFNSMRRAPDSGYDFARKRDYRRRVWATFRDQIKKCGASVSESHALLMPSLECDEIDVALNAGFREQHLHAVDDNPAVVAMIKRRYRRINTYGVIASKACERIARSGIKITCANFDFCNQASYAFTLELTKISITGSLSGCCQHDDKIPITFETHGSGGMFSDDAFVAVSMLRGREPKAITNQWKKDPFDSNDAEQCLAKIKDKATQSQLTLLKTRPEFTYLIDVSRRVSHFDLKRILFVGSRLGLDHCGGIVPLALRPDTMLIRTESYPSTNHQTMLWSLWKISSPISTMALAIAADIKRKSLGIPIPAHHNFYQEIENGDDATSHVFEKAIPLAQSILIRRGLGHLLNQYGLIS